MKVTEIDAVFDMERHITLCGWPRIVIRSLLTIVLITCASLMAIGLARKPSDISEGRAFVPVALQQAITQAISNCRQLNVPEEASSESGSASTKAGMNAHAAHDAPNPQFQLGGNWRVDSHGQPWVYDTDQLRWMRRP